jgi:hypothetical protein
MNPTERWSELWLLLDRHFPGERGEERSLKIDDLYVEVLRETECELEHLEDFEGDFDFDESAAPAVSVDD